MSKCPECGSEDIEVDDDPPYCRECGAEVVEGTAAAPEALGKYHNIVVGLVTEAVEVPKKSLTKLTVDIGADETITIVSNAKHLEAGIRVVCAKIGAVIGDLDNDGFTVTKTNVGGVNSEGVLCDCPMLNWTGGAAGAAVKLPESFQPGDSPPDERPRGK